MSSSSSSPQLQEKEPAPKDIIDEIEEKTQQLDEIFTEIDSYQEVNDNLQTKLSAITNEIKQLEREYKNEQAVKKAMTFERQSAVPGEVSLDLLSEEHRQFIKAKEDQVKLLSEKLDKKQNKYQIQEDEFNLLMTENNELELEKTKLDQESQKLAVSIKTLSQAANSKKTEINKQKNEMVVLQKDINDTQQKIQQIIEEMEANEVNAHDIQILQNEITYLEQKKENLNESIRFVNSEIQTFQDEEEKQKAQDRLEFENKKRIIGWETEEKSLNAEYKEVCKSADQVTKDLRATMEKNALLRHRLSQLRPIHKKWNKQFRGKTVQPVNEDIDSLLKKCSKRSKCVDLADTKLQTELQKIESEIQALEIQIAKRKENLESSMIQFKSQEINKKQQISDMRNNAFEKEHQIVEQIKALKIKTAEKQISNH